MKNRYFISFLLFTFASALDSSGAVQTTQDIQVAQAVKSIPIFARPILWVGDSPPPPAESQQLLDTLAIFYTNPKEGIQAVEQFITSNPASAWTPSLHANLGHRYRNMGRYSLAL